MEQDKSEYHNQVAAQDNTSAIGAIVSTATISAVHLQYFNSFSRMRL